MSAADDLKALDSATEGLFAIVALMAEHACHTKTLNREALIAGTTELAQRFAANEEGPSRRVQILEKFARTLDEGILAGIPTQPTSFWDHSER